MKIDKPSVYDQIREDILNGRLQANERLKISVLSERYHSTSNPIREALQQLRGEGFVLLTPNKGSRVRPIDKAFVRDIYEIEVLIEPYLTRRFADLVTDEDIAILKSTQDEIERLNFKDIDANSKLDEKFHRTIYGRHYNRHAVELWWRHRKILGALSSRFPIPVGRRLAIVSEHRDLIRCFESHDVEGAVAAMTAHISGAGLNVVEQIRSAQMHKPDQI